MRIIIPMAGWGKRLRPHTLTVPKPMVQIVGKPIVHRLVEDLASTFSQKIEEVVFIIRKEFGAEIENQLKEIADSLNTMGTIAYQDEPLGTAHAVLCAGEALDGNLIVAFADTLFETNYSIDPNDDGVIWVKRVKDPSAYGVVKLDEQNHISDFVEKPQEFVSDMAIIGIYYFKDGAKLRNELQYLIDNDIRDKGEYQLTNALENLKAKGSKFVPGEVAEWLDCGNKKVAVYTNQRVLELKKNKEELISNKSTIENSIIHEPCMIGKGAVVRNSVIGPHVTVGKNSCLYNCLVKNSIIQESTSISNKIYSDSMIGKHVNINGSAEDVSIGDYTEIDA